jgi:hypothetical protein
MNRIVAGVLLSTLAALPAVPCRAQAYAHPAETYNDRGYSRSSGRGGSGYTRPDPMAARREAIRRQAELIEQRHRQRVQANNDLSEALSALFSRRSSSSGSSYRPSRSRSYDSDSEYSGSGYSDNTPSYSTPSYDGSSAPAPSQSPVIRTDPTEDALRRAEYEAARRAQQAREAADREAARRELQERVQFDFKQDERDVLSMQDEKPADDDYRTDPLFQVVEAALPSDGAALKTNQPFDALAQLPRTGSWRTLTVEPRAAEAEMDSVAAQIANSQLEAAPPSEAQLLGFADPAPDALESTSTFGSAARSFLRDTGEALAQNAISSSISNAVETENDVPGGALADSPIVGSLFDRAMDAVRAQVTDRLAPQDLQDSPGNSAAENAGNKLFREAHPANLMLDVAQAGGDDFIAKQRNGVHTYMDRIVDNFDNFMGFAVPEIMTPDE